MKFRIEISRTSITLITSDAIVNAANSSLLGGGGVDGAIHRAAGPGLLEECRTIGGCPAGEARITLAYSLPAHFIIHTVGPVWHGGNNNEKETLARCYHNTYRLASEHRVKSIALPAISTGAYRFPRKEAASIALGETRAFMKKTPHSSLELFIFTCFDDEMENIYRSLHEEMTW